MSLFYQVLKRYPRGLKGEGWDMGILCYNPNLPMDFIMDHPEGVYCMNDQGELILTEWDWHRLSNHKHLNWDLVREHPDKSWDWDILSNRDDLNYELVKELSGKPWDMKIKVKPLQEVMLELDDWTSQELSRLSFNGYLPGSRNKPAK